jgi:ssDNA thymidine ADP-ribosyltransferase, DarT
MIDLNKKYLFRMTHIDNIAHIIENGITHFTSLKRNPDYVPIGDGKIIQTRKNIILKNNKSISDYIPFYFGTRMPMLYVIQKGFNDTTTIPAEQIVYCITSVQQLLEVNLEFVFTNGHALAATTTFYYERFWVAQLDDLLDFNAIRAKYWNEESDLDLKRRKEAECLVASDIPAAALLGYAVYNEVSKIKLTNLGILPHQIVIKPNYYF